MLLPSLLSLLLVLPSLHAQSTLLIFDPTSVTLCPHENVTVQVRPQVALSEGVSAWWKEDKSFTVSPQPIHFDALSNDSLTATITATSPANEEFLEIGSCSVDGNATAPCPLDTTDSFVRVRIIRSHAVDVLVVIVGWAYFLAWSISFYPQIILNFRRKSVIGLHFDFVFLNTIGFFAYSLYNCLIYFDSTVQAEYKAEFPRSPLPVLLNDVVFALHAFAACVVTGLQAIFLEKQNQRVSRICLAFSALLIAFGIVTGILALVNVMTLLKFVDCLSYIKLAVTLSKYFPQAIFNWRRKSTVGWSIGNILLDFTGGTLDLLQIALQGWNVANFSAIIGNPVKFSLGFVSIFFDIIFMIQHYGLYREAPKELSSEEKSANDRQSEYQGFDNDETPTNPSPLPRHSDEEEGEGAEPHRQSLNSTLPV